MTTKAVEDLLPGADGERRCLLLMKRATRHPVRALFLELYVVLDDPDDVCLSFEIVDECLGVTHLSNGHGFTRTKRINLHNPRNPCSD